MLLLLLLLVFHRKRLWQWAPMGNWDGSVAWAAGAPPTRHFPIGKEKDEPDATRSCPSVFRRPSPPHEKQTNKQTNKQNKQTEPKNKTRNKTIPIASNRQTNKQTTINRSGGRSQGLARTAKTSSEAIPPIIMRSQPLMYHWNPGKASKIL